MLVVQCTLERLLSNQHPVKDATVEYKLFLFFSYRLVHMMLFNEMLVGGFRERPDVFQSDVD